jgi:hypothetical protein
MEEQIIKWKNMWKEQKSNSLNANELIKRLNKIERKAKFQRSKLLVLLVILTIASIIFLSELLFNKFFIITYALTFTAILIKLIPLYRTKYRLITDQSDLNNHDFIKILLKKMTFKTKHLLIYMFVVILALNFILLGAYEKGIIFNIIIDDGNRIFFHLATIVLFVIAYLSNKKSMNKNKEETLKLISDLENNNS